MPAEDITLYAKWDVNQYTITFNSNGGTEVSTISQDYNTTVTAPDEPEKAGYTFVGWYSDEDLTHSYTFTTVPAEDITLYAKWLVNPTTINFESNGGTEVSSITQEYNSTVIAPNNPTKTGYTFDGWYTDNNTFLNEYIFDTMPVEDITLYAKWIINEYTISFESNGGSEVDSITQDYNTSLIEPNIPTRTYYTFEGWYSDEALSNPFTFATMPAENITLYAKWTINEYTINFESNGGNEVTSITQDYNTMVLAPSDPERTGYIFEGWYSDETLTNSYTFTTMPAENITLYAKWTINEYTMSFESNGGSEVTSITQEYNTIVLQPTDPTRTDYTFEGWYSDIGLTIPYTFTTMPAENITIYAKWSLGSSEGLLYTHIDEYTTSVSGYEGNSGYVIIPRYYDNRLVTIIEENAFNYNQDIISVIIPKDVTVISYKAFDSAFNLTNVEFEEGSSLTTIEAYAFRFTTGLNHITLPQTVTSIGSYSFARSGITTITFEAGSQLTTIENYTFNYAEELTSITIPKGVTELGGYTFDHATSLETVIFEEDSQLTNIGIRVFYYTSSLTSIHIPSSVTTLGQSAFAFSGLSSITFETGSQLQTISPSCFNIASNLIGIDIPSSVTSIGSNAFLGASSLEYINVDPNNVNYSSDNGVLYNMDQTSLILYPRNKQDISYSIPSTVTSIESFSFSGNTYLTSISIPNSVTTIGDAAFAGTTGITSINIPANVTNIGNGTFSNMHNLMNIQVDSNNTNYLSLDGILYDFNQTKLIQYPSAMADETFSIPNTVVTIEDYAFCYTKNLGSIVIPTSVTTIKKRAFFESNISSVIFETGSQLTTIEEEAFAYTEYLTHITIPESVTFIGLNAFNDSTTTFIFKNLTPPTLITSLVASHPIPNDLIIYVPSDALSTYTSANVWSKYSSYIVPMTSEGLVLTDNGGTYSVSGYTGTASHIIIPANYNNNPVTEIEMSVFYTNANIQTVIIPNSIKTIGQEAFRNSSLQTVIFESGSQLITIEDYAFLGVENLESILIPSSVTDIGNSAFKDTLSLSYIGVEKNNTQYSSIDGVLYNKNQTLLVQYPIGKLDSTYDILDTVTEIWDYAFYNASHLTYISIPNSVTIIGNYAFSYATSLEGIDIPLSVFYLPNSSLFNTQNLMYINVDSHNLHFSSIDGVLFDKSQTILIHYPSNKPETSYVIPYTVETVDVMAFYETIHIDTITISNSVTTLEQLAFSKSNINNVLFEVNSQLTNIGNDAFADTNLTTITLPASVTSIGFCAFNNSTLTTLILESETPPSVVWLLTIPNDFKIYVPASSVDIYKLDTEWSQYASYIYSIDDYII